MFEKIVIKELAKEFSQAKVDVGIKKDAGKEIEMTIRGTDCDIVTAYLLLGKVVSSKIELDELDAELCVKVAEYINDNAETTNMDI